ncbi:TetR/AcrR family transcriptional regulator [Streptomyces griseoloalbus]|uniref:AcrR family transcriptional regulator n=1 Tax=Streptomyces griseoloalbus TaxID=67303 RepID=A0A7W8FCC7_9ACTN|nr:TetR/AcrR family transcriptional regulator [Streptomyces albaduncus]MBB5129230.1 AcrR family transcriptional regulator [Streptomyces albaduncus]GGV81506.1 TetR family transcriptional regulator [Streptomyces griseoloalbus]GGW65363.1 TetR family transcriptional regulator [Streptomyces albaduncus]
MSRSPDVGSTSEARARLLNTATRIFYAEGIHSVGIDRITAEARVTRATLYRHFSGKEELVLAYLDLADRGIRGQIAAAQASSESAVDKVRAVGRSITDGIRSPGFRGCAFLNAAAEYPDATHPIHQAVLAHRQWFLDTVTDLLAQTGDAPADAAGRHLVMLRDGAMAAGCLFDPELISETFLHGVEGILQGRTAPGTASGADTTS